MDQQPEQQRIQTIDDTPMDDWDDMIKAGVAKLDVESDTGSGTVNPALILSTSNPPIAINHPPPRSNISASPTNTTNAVLHPSSSRTTGYVWDQAMKQHAPMVESEEGHPESPERIDAIREILQRNGLLAKMQKLPIRECTVDEVCLVHSLDHWNSVQGIASAYFNSLPAPYCLL